MYYTTAQKWIDELQEQGKLNDLSKEELDALLRDYAHRLEDIFNQEVTKLLEKYGKAEEFERMLLYDSQYMSKYLNQTIPGYMGFRMEVFEKAKKIILGE